jgi:hypothetical protein
MTNKKEKDRFLGRSFCKFQTGVKTLDSASLISADHYLLLPQKEFGRLGKWVGQEWSGLELSHSPCLDNHRPANYSHLSAFGPRLDSEKPVTPPYKSSNKIS